MKTAASRVLFGAIVMVGPLARAPARETIKVG